MTIDYNHQPTGVLNTALKCCEDVWDVKYGVPRQPISG